MKQKGHNNQHHHKQLPQFKAKAHIQPVRCVTSEVAIIQLVLFVVSSYMLHFTVTRKGVPCKITYYKVRRDCLQNDTNRTTQAQSQPARHIWWKCWLNDEAWKTPLLYDSDDRNVS